MGRWSTENYALSLNLTIQTSGICITLNKPGEWDAQRSLGIWKYTQITTSRPDDQIKRQSTKIKRTCRMVDYAISANHRVKVKEREKRDTYLDIAWELQKLRNMKMTVIPTVSGALGTVAKRLGQGLEGLEIRERVKIIQATVLLRSGGILRRVMETSGDLLLLKLESETIN